MPVPVVKQRARGLRTLGEEKAREFRKSQAGRELRVLTLRDERDSADTTPALSSNYLRIAVQGKFAPNAWLNVVISERDEKTVGEMVNLVSAVAV